MRSKLKKINQLEKVPSGIAGLDEITNGGFPKGRCVLVCGSAGCGKTLMGMQFLIKGIQEYNEPGVFMSFEEPARDLMANVASMGIDLNNLINDKKLKIDYVHLNQSEIEETGEFDLEGLFVRLNHAIDSIGAKRVVIDTIESIFGDFHNTKILRSELNRLFKWLKNKGVTAVITGEKGENTFTRHGLEEYISDCVIFLDFRVSDQIATRRLRIVKYRGSTHGTNEYPFLIDNAGLTVLPITSLKLEHKSSREIVSTGLTELDNLFSSKGAYRGSSILLTGTSGTAKTILAANFALSCCKRKERVLFFSFEESPEQLIRNMAAVGINLQPYVKSGMLVIHASRPTYFGLERHLIELHKYITEHEPKAVIIDPISSLISIGSASEVHGMLVRIMDHLKTMNITALFTSLTRRTDDKSDTEEAISSLCDTWIKLRNEESDHIVTRSLFIVKSRGMGHSGIIQDFIITDKGIKFTQHHSQINGIPVNENNLRKKEKVKVTKQK